MAEAVVGFVLEKLASFVANELEHLGGVGENVQQVHRELIRIQCCLIDADRIQYRGNAMVQNWLNELRDVAYRIEDATDKLLFEVEDDRQNDHSCWQNIKKVCKRPLKMHTLHKLGNELKNILKELEEISKSRDNYGMTAPQDIVEEVPVMSSRRTTYQEVDEREIIGMDADKNNILGLLRLEVTPRRAVITIVGQGGLGKTTLAHMVYRSARVEFEYHIMLSISQQFSLINLLKKMLRQLENYESENQDLGALICQLKEKLSSKRYLIILDDVWTVDLWNQLQVALPDVENGSRILITSRSIDVATSADPEMHPYKINFLDAQKSLDLLVKKALPDLNPDEECPSNLRHIAEQLSNKCNGLPLALIVIGGILSTRGRDVFAWERVLRTMDWQTNSRDCMDILAMSYQDMPHYLKTCFLYLASFPEDYKIPAKVLIRMWIAEGFISYNETTTKEETAENYLDELFQRSMIQVSSRCMYGLIKSFKVHDLLHDLAKHEAKQQNFVTYFSQASYVNQPNRVIRRASLQYHALQTLHENPQFVKYLGRNTRSLLLFEKNSYKIQIQLPKFSNFRQLKVLDLVKVANYDRDYEINLEKLIYLKYLRFRKCQIKVSPFSFHRMKSLETLDLRHSAIRIPNFSWAPTLRHVWCDSYLFEGPNSTDDLINLQTMKWIMVPRSWDTELPRLNNLRKLAVMHLNMEDWAWDALTNLLRTLSSLISLTIRMANELPMEIVYPNALPHYENLHSLYLDGEWPSTTTLEASLLPRRLVKLKLSYSKLRQNPIPELGKLKYLKKLYLITKVIESFSFGTNNIISCSEGFPVLQCLNVSDGYINVLVVANGVMPMLTYLEIHGQLNLILPPELQHVTVKKISSLC